MIYSILAYTLLHLGEVQLRQGLFKDANKTLEKALDIFTKIEDGLGVVYTKINFGIIEIKNQNWKKAKEYFLNSVEILNDLDASFYLGEVYLALSMVMSKMNNMDLANEFKANASRLI